GGGGGGAGRGGGAGGRAEPRPARAGAGPPRRGPRRAGGRLRHLHGRLHDPGPRGRRGAAASPGLTATRRRARARTPAVAGRTGVRAVGRRSRGSAGGAGGGRGGARPPPARAPPPTLFLRSFPTRPT